ncbi:MAG: GntR family transcriptional regulator [Clostridiales bacterium]|nr:GntR family transcriptional regulator [Clostridiales bacterium]
MVYYCHSVLVNHHTNTICLKGSDFLAWQFTSDRPIYIQVSDQIVSDILKGAYKMGEKLPSVREFAVIAAVNPNTVQKALSELESVGLIETQRNTGKFVTQERSVIEMARKKRGELLAVEFLKSMAALGYTCEQTISLLEATKIEEGKSDERSNA